MGKVSKMLMCFTSFLLGIGYKNIHINLIVTYKDLRPGLTSARRIFKHWIRLIKGNCESLLVNEMPNQNI